MKIDNIILRAFILWGAVFSTQVSMAQVVSEFSFDEVCLGLETTFTNSSTTGAGNIILYSWDFGDGTGSNLIAPRHEYEASGDYVVQLTILTDQGESDISSQQVSVLPAPILDFTITNPLQCLTSEFEFQNNSVGIDTQSWGFGDGTSTDEDPTHTFGTIGVKQVTLTATHANGCLAELTKEFEVYPNPQVDFQVDNVCFGAEAEFTNETSITSGNLTYAWDFDDGNLSTETNPRHDYTSIGQYAVSLTATSERGCTATNTLSGANLLEVFEQPNANFTFSNVCLGQEASFTNTTTGPDFSELTFDWDFGDNQGDNSQDTEHTYDAPSSYNVTLEASTSSGCTSRLSRVINVNPLPTADFSVENVCLGSPITPENLSTVISGGLTHQWDFGDSNTSTEENPTHTYGLDNTYFITLTSTSDFSCSSQVTKEVLVSPASANGGTTTGEIRLCSGDPTVRDITVSGFVGEVIRWESSLTNSTPWSTINETSTTLSYSNLLTTTYYRAVVKSGACSEAISSVTQITVDEATEAGSIFGNDSDRCSGNNIGQVYITGNLGNVVEWQLSTESPTSGFVSEAVFDEEYTYTNIEENTYFRALVQNGVCERVLSPVATVEVAPVSDGGLLSGAALVCSEDNFGTLDLQGYTGDIVYWEVSDNGLAPWNSINIQEEELEYENLATSKFYRAVVQSGDCPIDESNTVIINVIDNTDPGHLEGVSGVCEGENSGTLTLVDNIGDVVRWEYNENGTDWLELTGVTDTEYSFENLTQTTTYRVYVRNGQCLEEVTPNFEVTVNPLPVVSFTNDEVCEGTITSFTNTSTVFPGTNERFVWNFGNGNVRFTEEPSFLFDTEGVYSVSLEVVTDQGCQAEVVQSVEVNPVPETGIFVENNCVDLETVFTDNTILARGSIATYLWEYGDGNTGSAEDPTHTYAVDGEYTINLTTTSDRGCVNSAEATVEIYPRSVPQFEAENACFGEEIIFRNNSQVTLGNLFFEWQFGDGNNSLVEDPLHEYDAPGDYLVSLQVTTNQGCRDFITDMVTVYPQPEVSFTTESVCVDAPMVFTNTTITSSASITYEWDFGDTNNSTEENPSHQYGSFGNYEVILDAVTADGCTGSFTQVVVIEPLPQVNFSIDDVCLREEISAFNNSTIPNGTLTYLWDLGNGDSRTDRQFNYLYEEDGEYEVLLTATSDFGCVSSDSKVVTIHPLPIVDFEVEEVCDGFESHFQNTTTIATGDLASYIWDFGDQTNSIVSDPVKQYLNAGIYEVALQVESDEGCVDAIAKEYAVLELPIADFEAENICSDVDLEIQDFSYTPDGTLQYVWDMGNGETAFVPEPSSSYPQPGQYEVKVVVTSGNGCQDSLSKMIDVFYLPDAYAGEDVSVSKGFPVRLGASGGVSYTWTPIATIDDSQAAEPFVTPLETTIYTVEVVDSNGCTDTDDVTVNVIEDYKVIPSNVMTPDGNGMNDTWIVGNIERFEDSKVIVFDRWGKIVMQQIGYQNDWAGTSGKDILPDGTYYYTISFPEADRNYSGAITIMRNK